MKPERHIELVQLPRHFQNLSILTGQIEFFGQYDLSGIDSRAPALWKDGLNKTKLLCARVKSPPVPYLAVRPRFGLFSKAPPECTQVYLFCNLSSTAERAVVGEFDIFKNLVELERLRLIAGRERNCD